MGRTTRRNKITDKETLSKINPENSQLVSDFLEYLKSTGKSDTTIAVYKNDLDIAMTWCYTKNNDKSFIEWTKREVLRFQNWLITDLGNSPARVRRVKAVLSSMSNYISNILDEEYPTFKNIINKIESPALQPVREKTIYEEEEIQLLLDKLVDRQKYEQACVVALAAYSGRRKSELCRFKVSDFDDDKMVCGGALYKSAPIKTKGRGGGKYINCYTLVKKFKPYFDMWMKYREEHGIESEWLFPKSTNSNEHMEPSTIDCWTGMFSEITGKPFYMHSLRHAFATMLSRAGIPDGVIQSIVSWESADMVRLYVDIDADEQIAAYFSDGDICVREAKSISSI